MSSDALERVHALQAKADELCTKGHLLRAAENFGRAAEAADALGDDCIIAANQRLRQGLMHSLYVMTAPEGTAEAHTLAAHRAECVALYSAAVAALERRRAAGTLRPGRITASEVAWRVAVMRRRNSVHFDAAEAPRLADGVLGYEQFLHAAAYVLGVLAQPQQYGAAECSPAQRLAFARCVVHAAQMLVRPHGRGSAGLGPDAKFMEQLYATVAMGASNGMDESLLIMLLGALELVERSRVAHSQDIAERLGVAVSESSLSAFEAMRESMTAPGLRGCALGGCGAREAHPGHFKNCGACLTVVYCGKAHQVEGWPSHKKACKAARKAAAAAAAAAAEDDGAGPSGA